MQIIFFYLNYTNFKVRAIYDLVVPGNPSFPEKKSKE